MRSVARLLAIAILVFETMSPTLEGSRAAPNDRATAAALDREYQAAVKKNDAETMARILHDDFWLVLGNGTVITREGLLEEARAGAIRYERQDEVPGTQGVHVWNDTAVVTAKLWVKGAQNGREFDHLLWFTVTYVRTPTGRRYACGQASLPLPKDEPAQDLPCIPDPSH